MKHTRGTNAAALSAGPFPGSTSLRILAVATTAYFVSGIALNGQKLEYAEARASNTAVSGSVTRGQANASAIPPVILPLEVLGPDGTIVTARFNLPDTPNLNHRLKLWLEIHALRFETEASLQLNWGAWIPINSSTATIEGLGARFGGIGGGYSTLKMTMNLRLDDVHAGTNEIAFRFNGTDGLRSGFRVLKFNIVGFNGERLIPQSTFVDDDPSKWQPPLNSPADIQAGKTLWKTASLTAPGMGAIKATCGDCHAQDGRDLKYFNYSNVSIRARSMFHGLTAHEGDQIASYIRSLNVPNPGRPWNPPYQPGPGLDSQPVANWAAGAGLEAVLDSDSQMQPYLMPGGSTASWSANSYLNAREVPIVVQLLDWNSWLPVIHPMDAFGDSFNNSSLNGVFHTLRNSLEPNSPATYMNATVNIMPQWNQAENAFTGPILQHANWRSPNMALKVYSIALWMMVKSWEMNQEFGLEGMPQVPFGAKADKRGWYGSQAFYTAPDMLHIPPSPGLGDGTQFGMDYLKVAWWQTQLILNDGQGQQAGHMPIDFPYVGGAIRGLFVLHAKIPGIMLQLEWNLKALQEVTLTGVGPEAGALGWHAAETYFGNLVNPGWLPLWSAMSREQQAELTRAYTRAWLAQASRYTPQQYYQGGWANPDDDPSKLGPLTFGGQLWYALPDLRRYAEDPKLTDEIVAWAGTLWPRGDWASRSLATQ